MELKVIACDPEGERSRKILQPDNEKVQGRSECGSRLSFCHWIDAFLRKSDMSVFSWRQELRIRMREAGAAVRTEFEGPVNI